MAQIRQRLHQDMQGVVAGAEAAADWKHYVKMYPFVALGLACAAGYLVVPRKRRSVSQTAEKAAQAVVDKLTETPVSVPAPTYVAAPTIQPVPKKSGIFGSLFGMVTPIVVKAAQNYALNYVGTLMEQMQEAAGPPRDESPIEPVRPQPTHSPLGGKDR